MFEKIILCDDYSMYFLKGLEKDSLIRREEWFYDLGISINKLEEADNVFGNKNRNNIYLTALQMAMLAEEIIIPDIDGQGLGSIDLSTCKNFDIKSYTPTINQDEYTVEQDEFSYIDEYVFPIVWDRIKGIDKSNIIKPDIVKITLHCPSSEIDKYFDIFNLFYPPEFTTDWTEWTIKIYGYALDIMCIQETSALFYSPTLSYKYSSKSASENIPYNSQLDTYALVKIGLDKVIGTVPILKNANDVLRLKDNRKADISRLRVTLDEFDNYLRNYGHAKALDKIILDINKASRELSNLENKMKTTRWANYLLLPISVIEEIAAVVGSEKPLFSGLSIVSHMGFSLEIVSLIANSVMKRRFARNNWLDLVR